MTKQDIRSLYKKKRRAITAEEKDRLEDLMLIRFQEISEQVPLTVMSYIPFERENEYDPEKLIRFCRFRNPELQVACPVINHSDDELKAVELTDDQELTLNSFGIPEPLDSQVLDPESISMVIVPLLAFDLRGYRVGYGKGYYDRFLATKCPDAIRVGVSFFEPVPLIDGVHDGDEPLDYCVTPERLYTFTT